LNVFSNKNQIILHLELLVVHVGLTYVHIILTNYNFAQKNVSFLDIATCTKGSSVWI
jgi:hypothetical protein